MTKQRRLGAWLAVVGFLVVAASCIDADAVFEQLPLFGDPPAAAQGFLGYSDPVQRQTFCGNCHIGQHAEWRQTAHAVAWDTLQNSGLADPTCEECHTVGANGNVVTDPNVAWAATGDSRYHDVQCESCHGPGLEHVLNPDAFQPLPPVSVGVSIDRGCGECHTGAHQPFVEEWAQSRHGNMNPFPQTREDCVQCHELRGIFEAWGVRSNFLEEDQVEPIPITCAVCHDPHDASNPKQLRFPIDEPNQDTNLCVKCHNRRGGPDPSTGRGPHSPQGPLLLGTAGWRPPDFVFADDTIVSTHGTEANPRLCATCHVNPFPVTDLRTGELVFDATGHLFQAIPCLDAEGKPTTSSTCANSERSFAACALSGCHATPGTAVDAFEVVRGRVDGLVATLNARLGLVPASEFDDTDNRLSVAEGALFNAQLGELRGSAVHNPFLIEALLNASLTEVEATYPEAARSPGRDR